MSTELAPASPSLAPVAERFANPLAQLRGLIAQPAVRRSLPLLFMLALVAAAAGAWMMLSTPPQKTLFQQLPDADKAAVVAALEQANISAQVDQGTGAVTVGEDDFSRARMLLASQGLPKAAPGGYAILDQLPMGVSRAVEGERLRQARETELARSIQEIDAVAEARVHLAMPEASVFVRDSAAPTASVIVKLQPGRSLAEAQVSSIINLVASSVPGMKPDAVTIVDQMGALLSHAPGEDGGSAAAQARIDFQRRIEEKYRQQLAQLLTPLVGAGNFSAEVQADVDLDETQATRESYDKQGALRAEQGNWSSEKDGANAQPGGIPGALSNTPTPAATVTPAPKTPPAAPGTTPANPAPGTNPPPADTAVAAAAAPKTAETFTRAYDLNKEISVTRAVPGRIKRLSVAVLLRDPEKGRPRSPVEIQQINQLVRTAVGFDQTRNDQVTVIARKFAGPSALDKATPWYEEGWVAVAARNGTAILIALMVLLFGVRPIAKGLMKKRDEAPKAGVPAGRASGGAAAAPGMTSEGFIPAPADPTAPAEPVDERGQRVPVSIEMLQDARSYDERVGMVRGFTRDNPTRAALAVRDMIRADAN
ncbi:flagellar basal-body MS-ring/collar protein FliF [Sphingomonas sp.]|uniref:flagellar basal-body MS-ring/collar protein FliF n=1 Tax=Sphingomonas sp. TaxID=28214 RepID=UPI001D91E3F7|nr:flagellar basal-body MS-ring/collar protein FliF [Sphingomonas sp.]MBX9795358.1 flagellar M-ring protein FliF [Sphingomonas sp.]